MKDKKKKGFTIIELIASVAIFILISVAAISMISLGVKYNSVNRETYKADLVLKSFYETLKSKDNRPNKQSAGAGVPNGQYVYDFNNVDEVVSYVKTKFSPNSGLTSVSVDTTNISALESYIGNYKAPTGGYKHTLLTKVEWDATNKMYKINMWCWEKSKGIASMVDRKFEIRAKL